MSGQGAAIVLNLGFEFIRDHNRHRVREHEGRGYWRNGAWIEF
jgi:hypothetical protein